MHGRTRITLHREKLQDNYLIWFIVYVGSVIKRRLIPGQEEMGAKYFIFTWDNWLDFLVYGNEEI